MARIAAEMLARHLERSGFVVMKKPPKFPQPASARPHADYARNGKAAPAPAWAQTGSREAAERRGVVCAVDPDAGSNATAGDVAVVRVFGPGQSRAGPRIQVQLTGSLSTLSR
jgi:hypothetical protein